MFIEELPKKQLLGRERKHRKTKVSTITSNHLADPKAKDFVRCQFRQSHKSRPFYVVLLIVFIFDTRRVLQAIALSSPDFSSKPQKMASVAAAAVASQRPIVSEIVLQCSDGVRLAAQSWRRGSASPVEPRADSTGPVTRRILCLHGWMDNCRSFHYLAPELVNKFPSPSPAANSNSYEDVEVVALDLPGHGLSSHNSKDGPPTQLAAAAYYVSEAVEQLQWYKPPQSPNTPQEENPCNNKFTLVGHSMGAAVSCLYAAAFPEQVEKLVLLEGVGPLARKARDVAQHVRLHVQRRQMGNKSESFNGKRIYPSLEKAVETRCFTARKFPGKQYLSVEAAREMVSRGSRTVSLPNQDGREEQIGDMNGNTGVQFIHDPRLQWPSLQYFTVEQTEALYQDVQCPTALIIGEDGWPFEEESMGRCLDLLEPKVVKTLPGSHHLHADPDTAPAVADEVCKFLYEM